MIKKTFPLWLLILLLHACTYDEAFKIVNEKNLYTLEIASYLTKTRDLSTIPSLQYHNRFRTVYLVIKNDLISTIDMDFESYRQEFVNSFLERFPDAQLNTLPQNELNGYPAIMEEIVVKTDGEKVWYLSATVKGKKHYYQILSWTLDHRKEKYEQDIRQMVQSFQIL